MITFGKKLRECRETKGLSQQEFAKMLKTSHSVIGRYERDEMVPSIEVVKKMADLLEYNCWLFTWGDTGSQPV